MLKVVASCISTQLRTRYTRSNVVIYNAKLKAGYFYVAHSVYVQFKYRFCNFIITNILMVKIQI
jgi:hypothetical protein